MFENASSTPEPVGRRTPSTWPADWAFPGPEKHRTETSSHRDGRRIRASLLAVLCFALGALAGSIAGASIAGQWAHPKGACSALHMAAAHGYLDERQQRVVMRALTTVINPDVELFPGGYRAMREACALKSG